MSPCLPAPLSAGEDTSFRAAARASLRLRELLLEVGHLVLGDELHALRTNGRREAFQGLKHHGVVVVDAQGVHVVEVAEAAPRASRWGLRWVPRAIATKAARVAIGSTEAAGTRHGCEKGGKMP
jgi:hypothetical protein